MVERDRFIDFLRGFSIFAIILIHANAFFLHDKIAFTLWNISQFSVPVFIFCSTYLFLKGSLDRSINFFSYLRKRFLRLLIPYYIFLFIFLICLFIFSPQVITTSYIWKSLILIGGVDVNWLVLLFLYITIILPFFAWSFKKAKFLFWLFFVLSFGSACFLLFNSFDISYKWTMWLPWSVIFYFTLFYIKFENKRRYLSWVLFFSSLLLLITLLIKNNLHHDLAFRSNKYPPNILYLSFGVSSILALSLFTKSVLKNKFIMSVFDFFSKYSYSIFFIHYVVLTVLVLYIKQFHFNWFTLFLAVLFITILLQKMFNWTRIKLKI